MQEQASRRRLELLGSPWSSRQHRGGCRGHLRQQQEQGLGWPLKERQQQQQQQIPTKARMNLWILSLRLDHACAAQRWARLAPLCLASRSGGSREGSPSSSPSSRVGRHFWEAAVQGWERASFPPLPLLTSPCRTQIDQGHGTSSLGLTACQFISSQLPLLHLRQAPQGKAACF